MAYLDKETANNIKVALKKALPDYKLSITTADSNSITVSIIESDLFEDGEVKSVNPYCLGHGRSGKQLEVLSKINNIIKTVGKYYDNSDRMTDYFNVAFYYNINIGKWDRPHVNTAKTGAA